MGMVAIAALGTAAIGVGGMVAGHATERAGIKAEKQAAQRQAALEVAELDRQKGEVERIAAEDRSDREARLDRDLAAFNASFGFGGGAGSNNQLRGAIELDFAGEIDDIRLARNARADIQSLEAGQEAAETRADDANVIARIKRRQADIGLVTGLANAGAGIVSGIGGS